MRKSGGSSRTARRRRERAAELSKRMRRGDAAAALSLLQRRRALAGIGKHGWTARLAQANGTRRSKHRLEQERCEQEASRLATLHEHEQRAQNAAWEQMRKRAQQDMEQRFNRGPIRVTRGRGEHHYREGECRPVPHARGATCPPCGWQWGSREPNVVLGP